MGVRELKETVTEAGGVPSIEKAELRQLAIEATRAETLARRAGPAAEDSVWPGRQSIETFGDEAVPVGVDDIAEV